MRNIWIIFAVLVSIFLATSCTEDLSDNTLTAGDSTSETSGYIDPNKDESDSVTVEIDEEYAKEELEQESEVTDEHSNDEDEIDTEEKDVEENQDEESADVEDVDGETVDISDKPLAGVLSGDTLYVVIDGEMEKFEWESDTDEDGYVPDEKYVYVTEEDGEIVIDSVVTMEQEESQEVSLSSYLTGVIEGDYLIHTDYYGEEHKIYIASLKPENAEGMSAAVEGSIVMLGDDVNVTSGYVGLQEPYVSEISGTIILEELGNNVIAYIVDSNDRKKPVVLDEQYRVDGAVITVSAISHGTYENESSQPFYTFYTVEEVVEFLEQ